MRISKKRLVLISLLSSGMMLASCGNTLGRDSIETETSANVCANVDGFPLFPEKRDFVYSGEDIYPIFDESKLPVPFEKTWTGAPQKDAGEYEFTCTFTDPTGTYCSFRRSGTFTINANRERRWFDQSLFPDQNVVDEGSGVSIQYLGEAFPGTKIIYESEVIEGDGECNENHLSGEGVYRVKAYLLEEDGKDNYEYACTEEEFDQNRGSEEYGYSGYLYGQSIISVNSPENAPTKGLSFSQGYASGHLCEEEEVVIPAYGGGESVKTVGGFRDNQHVKTVRLGPNVTQIATNGFQNSSIETLIIPEGVSISIPDQAFKNSNIKVISGGGAISKMGNSVFADCASLETIGVHLPDKIPSASFQGCSSLIKVDLSGTKELGSGAFKNCFGLEEANLGNSLESLGSSCFRSCTSLKKIVIPGSVKGVEAYCFQGCTALEELVLEEGVQIIYSYAFQGCTSLIGVHMPDSMEAVGYSNGYSFDGCTSLRYVRLSPNLRFQTGSIPTCEANCFCQDYEIKAVLVPSGLNWEENLLHNFFARGSKSLPTFYSEADGYQEMVMGGDYDLMLRDDEAIIAGYHGIGGEVTVPSRIGEYDITDIGANVFVGKGVRSLNFEEGIKRISASAFYEDDVLTEVTFPSGMESIGEEAFAKCPNLQKITFTGSINTIGDRAFESCANLISLTLCEGIENIGAGAFSSCGGLKGFLEIPESVVQMASDSFKGCSFDEVYIPATYAVEGVYQFGDPQRLEAPDSVCADAAKRIVIGNAATDHSAAAMTSAKEILIISSEVETVNITKCGAPIAFQVPELDETWTVKSDREIILGYLGSFSSDGFFYSLRDVAGEKSFVILSCLDTQSTTITVPQEFSLDGSSFYPVTKIGKRVFSGNYRFKAETIVLPETVEELGDYAFSENSYLVTLEAPGVKVVGDSCFSHTEKFANFNVNSPCSAFGDSAFAWSQIKSFPDLTGLSAIESRTFSNCEKVSGTLKIPSNIVRIGYGAFEYCSGITRLILPSSGVLESIGGHAFFGCSRLWNASNSPIDIPASVTYIGGLAFGLIVNSSSSVTSGTSLKLRRNGDTSGFDEEWNDYVKGWTSTLQHGKITTY